MVNTQYGSLVPTRSKFGSLDTCSIVIRNTASSEMGSLVVISHTPIAFCRRRAASSSSLAHAL
eukprot:170156-Prymnesium_polylepis.2